MPEVLGEALSALEKPQQEIVCLDEKWRIRDSHFARVRRFAALRVSEGRDAEDRGVANQSTKDDWGTILPTPHETRSSSSGTWEVRSDGTPNDSGMR